MIKPQEKGIQINDLRRFLPIYKEHMFHKQNEYAIRLETTI